MTQRSSANRDLGPLERYTMNHLCSTALKDYHFLDAFEREHLDLSEAPEKPQQDEAIGIDD